MIELENDHRVFRQWTLSQRVLLDGYKPGARVDYTLVAGAAEPLTVLAYEKDGHVCADVPNILLQKAGVLRVCVRPIYSDSQLRQIKDIRIAPAEKPEDYIYTETAVLMVDTELNAALDEMVKYYAQKKADEAYEKLNGEYGAELNEAKKLAEQCREYAILCNKMLQDCEKILQLCNEAVNKKGGEG